MSKNELVVAQAKHLSSGATGVVFWGLIGLGAAVVAFFAWDYYRVWRLKRGYQRLLESKRRQV